MQKQLSHICVPSHDNQMLFMSEFMDIFKKFYYLHMFYWDSCNADHQITWVKSTLD